MMKSWSRTNVQRREEVQYIEETMTKLGLDVKSSKVNNNEETKSYIERQLQRLIDNNLKDSNEYCIWRKKLAVCYLKSGDELNAIFNIVESHSAILREMSKMRLLKREIRKELKIESPFEENGININVGELDLNNGVSSLKSKLKELPKEWYMLQITTRFVPQEMKTSKVETVPIHLIHLPCGGGLNEDSLCCISLPKPKSGTDYNICNEILGIQESNRDLLMAKFITRADYSSKRKSQDERMRTAVNAVSKLWLREWRILLIADPLEKPEVAKKVEDMIDKLIKDSKGKVTKRTRWLLKKVATCSCYLEKAEIARAVSFLIQDNNKLKSNIIYSIFSKLPETESLKQVKRKTLALIVDEELDFVPFENLNEIVDHPVTRFISVQFAYSLFKEHEDSIVDGCKLVEADKPDFGSFIVDPSINLPKMCQRMKVFFDYWLPKWTGLYSKTPDPEQFTKCLFDNNCLVYCGHGSGINFLPGERIQKLRVKAIVFLFGCSSVKLIKTGGRFPPFGVSNHYLIAASPCVLGMLWEVTDVDIDRFTTAFLSNWIKSKKKKHWTLVDLEKWCKQNVIEFPNDEKTQVQNEPELLRAIAKSKTVTNYFMTRASVCVRGLPVKLV